MTEHEALSDVELADVVGGYPVDLRNASPFTTAKMGAYLGKRVALGQINSAQRFGNRGAVLSAIAGGVLARAPDIYHWARQKLGYEAAPETK